MINTPLAQRGKRSLKTEYVDTLVILDGYFVLTKDPSSKNH